ncbi:MAG TPA: hypothetical protein VMA72_04180 [Streptosporangiaceae bacterium]|nr:hypothetical protein [Streptosporangiaceae bacterium]
MRIVGDFRRLLVIPGACLALVTCGAAVSQAGTQPGATTSTQATVRPLAKYGNPAGHAPVPSAAKAVSTAHPSRVIGTGSPGSCTSAAVVRAVAKGGIIKFNCGPNPVTIRMRATAKVVNTHRRTVIDGGGKVTLSGGGKIRILYMNTCDAKQHITTSDCWQQKWPQLVVQNMRFTNAYSGVRQTSTSNYGGGAIFDQGGQLKVVNSGFFSNRCYKSGPDLGGAAIRALGMYAHRPVYLTDDTFRGGRCSNGGAVSGLFAGFAIYNSLFVNNKAIGFGANPSAAGTAGGGSGGAIYTDGGENYNVLVSGTAIRDCHAREGGGAIFFVIDKGDNGQLYKGNVEIEHHSVLHANPSGKFQNAPGIFDSVDGKDVSPEISGGSVVN